MFEEVKVVRATPHRIAALAGHVPVSVRQCVDGWCRVDGDLAVLSAATRTGSCALQVDDTGALHVLVHHPDGTSIGPLDADSAPPEIARAVSVFGLPDGAEVLYQAISNTSARYDTEVRLADACRALGIPLDLLAPEATEPQPDAPAPARPEVGVVLVYAPVLAAAADAPLTMQSAWTVPLGNQWSLHLWDGHGRALPVVHAAQTLADAQRPTLGYWWSERTAGFLLTRDDRVAGAHEWGGDAPATAESTAQAGRALAAEFRVPDQALTVISLLRRTDLAPLDALTTLWRLLNLPTDLIGCSLDELTAWAASVPGAVHTERLGVAAAVAHAVREAPPENLLEELSARRPLWYRLLNGLVAAAMAASTAVLVLLWHWKLLSGWWSLLGGFTTLSYAWGLRPARRRRPPGGASTSAK